ncbi:SDR family NAD(P)-dependent oxidoreductase [Mycolicibacterium helvum]|uniref:3-oxoacyl-ACP reductase n=1 Tax=Mycolicibacterium helvum TaxID=1534349 RepID=A0A7I7TE62_9MYCO|nr:SDR family oxidoreductase [Mycolicibacterium helvum]BBY67487.1 3-oxoacyl-ACP reductase [Mycolicibacterium helvum]
MTGVPTKSLPLTFSGGDAIVTGAASGIGAAVADLLLDAGIRTIALDVRPPAPRPRHRAELQLALAADVRDPDLTQRLSEAGVAVDDISYVVNCAGVLDNTGFVGVDRAMWLRALEINLIGAYNVIDSLAPALRNAVGAAVVNITSIEADRVVALTDPDPTPQYAASKAGLAQLTRTAARALAADGVRVNSISPGFVATPMAAAHGETGVLPASLAARVPAGRFATAADIAHAVAFLLSDQASYITGTDLRVDGGFELT